jgi:hypothetical protein
LDGKPYDYDQRSLPYIEDTLQYNQYEVVGDFSNIKYYIDNCMDAELKEIVLEYMSSYEIKIEELIVQKGKIKAAFDATGGGIQYQLPLPVDLLEDLKLLEKIGGGGINND